MNMLFQTVLSMSVSGALLILGMLLIDWLLKKKCSRRWQYYVWLLVIARLLLPFGPKESLMGRLSMAVPQADFGNMVFSGKEEKAAATQDIRNDLHSDIDGEKKTTHFPAQEKSAAVDVAQGRQETVLLGNNIGWIWFVIALGMLIRKIVKYQSFIRHVKAAAKPVSDISLLSRLSEMQWRTGVGKTVEFFVNPYISSPMLVGFWRPCIVMPDTHISRSEERRVGKECT